MRFMDKYKAIATKLTIASREEESAWRADFDAFCKNIDPTNTSNLKSDISEISQKTATLVNLKAALLINKLREHSLEGIPATKINLIQTQILNEIEPIMYLSRFDIIIESVKRKLKRYGMVPERSLQSVIHEKTLFETAVLNNCRRAQINVIADITLLRGQDKNQTKFETMNKVIELKPNFFGIGVNLNALIKLFKSS